MKVTVNEAGKKIVGDGVGFHRLRRITGYLVSDLKFWNNAKKAEEKDRVKHTQPKGV